MHILVADDHDLVRDAICAFISHAEPGMQIDTCASLDGAVRLVESGRMPEMAILDLNMPGMNGLEGLRRFIDTYPDVLSVLMSGNADQDTIEAAMQAGARGFLPKTMNARAFVNAIRLIASGERFLPMSSPVSDAAGSAPAMPALTRREGDVLGGMIHGWTNKEIARHLDLQEVTIKLHVKNILRKLSVRNRTEAAMRASALGWKPRAG